MSRCLPIMCCYPPHAQGSTVAESVVVKGMVLKRDTEGSIKAVDDAKVAAYTQVGGRAGRRAGQRERCMCVLERLKGKGPTL